MRLKSNALIVFIYSLLVLIGGFSGYLKAGSQVSLYAGSISFVILGLASLGIYKTKNLGYMTTIIMILILDAFFTLRYVQSLKFFPSGFMAAVSLLTLVILVFRLRKKERP